MTEDELGAAKRAITGLREMLAPAAQGPAERDAYLDIANLMEKLITALETERDEFKKFKDNESA
jgi:hypothetical protein